MAERESSDSEDEPAAPAIDIEALRNSHRGPNGQWVKGSMARLKHGLRVRPDQIDAFAGNDERVAQLKLQMEADGVSASLIETFVRLESLEKALGRNLEHGGALTGKGSTRAAVNCLFDVVDRKIRVASMLMTGKKPKAEEPQGGAEWNQAQAIMRNVNKTIRGRQEA